MTHQHLVRAKGVAVRTAGGWFGYPPPVGRPNELTLHLQEPICAAAGLFMTRPANLWGI
jgi:hypothetical protein